MSQNPNTHSRRLSLIPVFLTSILVLAADRWTKHLALTHLSHETSVPVLPGIFHFTLVENTGIAFGLFQQHSGVLFLAITVCVIALLYFSGSNHSSSLGQKVAYGLILGGAIGNWFDRVTVGHVIDFLDFRIWPVFNIADSCISVGVALYLFATLLEPKHAS